MRTPHPNGEGGHQTSWKISSQIKPKRTFLQQDWCPSAILDLQLVFDKKNRWTSLISDKSCFCQINVKHRLLPLESLPTTNRSRTTVRIRIVSRNYTRELDNRESVQYKELVTELTTEVRHCLLGHVGEGHHPLSVDFLAKKLCKMIGYHFPHPPPQLPL